MKILHFLTLLLWHLTWLSLDLVPGALSNSEAGQSNPGSKTDLLKAEGKERAPSARAGTPRAANHGFSTGTSKARAKSNAAQAGALLAKNDESQRVLSRTAATEAKVGHLPSRPSGVRTVTPKVPNLSSKAALKKTGSSGTDTSSFKTKKTKEPVTQREAKETFRQPPITPHEYMLSLYRTLSDAERKGVNGSVKLEAGLANTITSFIDKGQGKRGARACVDRGMPECVLLKSKGSS